jgi:hypothetical protein
MYRRDLKGIRRRSPWRLQVRQSSRPKLHYSKKRPQVTGQQNYLERIEQTASNDPQGLTRSETYTGRDRTTGCGLYFLPRPVGSRDE